MAASTTCRSCGAAIIFAATEAGKQMPLDAKPERRWTLNRNGDRCRQIETYTAHWVTCPHAGRHRRQG